MCNNWKLGKSSTLGGYLGREWDQTILFYVQKWQTWATYNYAKNKTVASLTQSKRLVGRRRRISPVCITLGEDGGVSAADGQFEGGGRVLTWGCWTRSQSNNRTADRSSSCCLSGEVGQQHMCCCYRSGPGALAGQCSFVLFPHKLPVYEEIYKICTKKIYKFIWNVRKHWNT